VLDPKSSQEMAQLRNPDLVAALHLERAALYDISSAAGSLLPEVSLDSSIARAIDSNTFTDERDSFQIGITVGVPLYQSGAEYAKVRELRMIAVQRRQESDKQRRIVRYKLFQSWEKLVTARARILSFETSVGANEIALDGVNQEANVGARTILDVLDAEQELFEAKVNLVGVKRDEAVALYNLLAISGDMTAKGLGLPVQYYDAGYHYSLVRDKWYGVNSDTSGGSILDFDFDSLDVLDGNSLLDWIR
jgi:outer membrane protein